jgi:hypothetical protein
VLSTKTTYTFQEEKWAVNITFETKALLLLTNDTLFQHNILHLSNAKHLKAENINTEVMRKEVTRNK